MEQLEDFDFKQAQFAVGDDKEIAAAASGIEKAEARELLMEAFKFGFADFGALKFRAADRQGKVRG